METFTKDHDQAAKMLNLAAEKERRASTSVSY